MSDAAPIVGERDITATRIFDAPRDLVFKLWTDPKHLANWWGPRGFTTTTFNMDVKPGGVWRFVMHGPDGTDFQNKITYVEVDAPKKLVYKHGGDKDVEPVNFQVTVNFDEHDGGRKTKLTMQMQFPSNVAMRHVIDKYGAVEGLKQTLGRLEEKLAKKNEPEEFVISRAFDAPRDLVWKAWTQRDRLVQWFGPKGWKMTTANLDFRPGGIFHYCLTGADGNEMWGKFVYREIIPPQRMVWEHSFSDAQGNLTRHPMAPTWPRQMITTVTFAEYEDKTYVTVRWTTLNATPEEQKTFDSSHDGMRMGWGGTFEQLAEYLAKA